MQYSQNKDHQHHKWRQQRSWISYQDCQGAQDKQRMQYLLILRSKWKILQNYWKFPNRNVQIFGHVYRSTNGLNHGPVWKIQSFLLNEICMVILWQDCCGKSYIRKSFLKFGWEKVFNWDLGEPTSFLDHVYLGCTQRQCERSKNIVDNYRTMFESRISAVWTEKLPYSEIFVFLRVLRYGKSCQEMCGTKLWVSKQDDSTTLQDIYSMHWWQEEEMKSVGELSKMYWNACTWHVLDDLIFSCRWTNLPDRLRNGPKPATNAWIAWFLTFITHVNIFNIVMWWILHNNAGWDCFKTPILREILRTQNLLRVEHCGFLEDTHLSQSDGCVRNKLQFQTVQQNLKSSLWTLDWG